MLHLVSSRRTLHVHTHTASCTVHTYAYFTKRVFFNGGFIIGNDYVRMYVTLVDLSWVVGRGRECSGRFVVGRGRECSDGCGLHSFEVFADYRVALHSG